MLCPRRHPATGPSNPESRHPQRGRAPVALDAPTAGSPKARPWGRSISRVPQR